MAVGHNSRVQAGVNWAHAVAHLMHNGGGVLGCAAGHLAPPVQCRKQGVGVRSAPSREHRVMARAGTPPSPLSPPLLRRTRRPEPARYVARDGPSVDRNAARRVTLCEDLLMGNGPAGRDATPRPPPYLRLPGGILFKGRDGVSPLVSVPVCVSCLCVSDSLCGVDVVVLSLPPGMLPGPSGARGVSSGYGVGERAAPWSWRV